MPHLHELIDYTVVAYIVYREKVLLCHHRTLNMWVPLGGHVELNEDPEEALFREIREESGLEIELIGEKPLIVPANFYEYPFGFANASACGFGVFG